MAGIFKFFEPCVPIISAVIPTRAAFVHEVKLDGWRLQAHRQGSDVKLYSRNGLDLYARFPEIADQILMGVVADNVVLDGELVFVGENGLPDFGASRKRGSRLCFYVFDLLWFQGDQRQQPLEQRKLLIPTVIPVQSDALRISESFEDGEALFKAVEGIGGEGIVSKMRHATYRSGRSWQWQKIKTKTWIEQNRGRWRMFR